MRRGLIAVLVSLLLFPGSAFAFQFSTPHLSNAVAGIGTFINNLLTLPTVAQHTEPAASAASAAATPPSTTPSAPDAPATPSPTFAPSAPPEPTPTATERTVYLQPQTIERTTVEQSAPLPDDLVHTRLLAELLAMFESKISAQISAITTPPPFPQQVAAGGNGVLSYGAAAAASSGGGGGISLSEVSSMIAAAINAAFAAIDHLTANTITATNSTLGSATATTLHVTGSTTLDTPLGAASGGTGVSSAPAYGQLLMGQANGTYALVSTSSLGIPGGTGIWGAITGTLSSQADLQNALNAKFSLSQWCATTTSALAEGSNLYFTNARADARINATTSIGTLQAAPQLASVGTITSGTWDAAAIGTPYGGTGLTSAPTYGQLLLGQSNGTYALVSTSSLGISGGGGSGTVSSGTQGQFAFYNTGGSTLTATSSLFLAQSGNIGIGTTSPFTTLSVNGSGYFTNSFTAPIIDNGGQVVNVLAYGAKNDGTGDNATAFNAAFASLSTTKGGTVVVPAGTYNFNSSVDLSRFTTGSVVRIEMDGATLQTTQPITIFNRMPADQTAAGVLIDASFFIHGGTFSGNKTTGQIGIFLGATYGSVIDGVHFNNLDIGFDGAFDLMMKVQNCRALTNATTDFKIESGVGSWTGASVNNSQSNGTIFENDRAYTASTATSSFMILASDGVTIRDSISEGGNPTNAIYFDDQNSTTVKSFAVDNFHSENTPTNAIITLRGRGSGNYTINRVFTQTATTLLDNNGFGLATINITNIPYVSSTLSTAFKLSAGTGGVYGTTWHFENWGDGAEDIANSTWWLGGNVPHVLFDISSQTNGNGISIGGGSLFFKSGINFGADNTYTIGDTWDRPSRIIVGTGNNLFAGNVAIGTTSTSSSPLSTLDIYGNFDLQGSSRYLNFGATSSNGIGSTGYGFRDNAGTLEFKNAGGSWASISNAGTSQWNNQGSNIYFSTGNVGLGTSTPWGRLSLTGFGTGTGIAFATADSNDSPKFVIQDRGYVGIGIASPSYKLDVSGFINTDQYSGYKQNGSTILYASSTNYATLVGIGAGASLLSSAPNNTAIGYHSLFNSTSTGIGNTAVGYNTLSQNMGNANTAVGNGALQSNASGNYNTAVGDSALINSTTGTYNTANGVASLTSNSSGGNNTANGIFALYRNINGSGNTASGAYALYNNNDATNTVAFGYLAGRGIGGIYNNQGGTYVGYGAGYNVQTGSDYNTLLGYQSGVNVTTGAHNIQVGYHAGTGGLSSGSYNILLGDDVRYGLDGTANNQLNIGNLIFSNSVGTGNSLATGNVGIGTSSPDMLLSVGSNSPSGSVAHFENSTGSCYINPTTTSLSCSSDSRLKTNVVPLESAEGLTAVLKLNPVTYNWKTESATTSPHTGFIAQDVQPILPDLVSQGPDGYYTLNYAGLTPYLVKAVQEIATITGVFKDNLIAWLGSATNGIHQFFADIGNFQTVNTAQLCISSGSTQTCITQQQLAALLSQAAAANPSTSVTSSGTAQASNSGNSGLANWTPPVITINGSNPATITVGSTYVDLGATITAPQADMNLGLTIVVDNATSTDGTVQIDTSKPGTHTILYTVTDPSGLTGSATRTVIVSAPQQTPPPANDNTASNTSATSTAQ